MNLDKLIPNFKNYLVKTLNKSDCSNLNDKDIFQKYQSDFKRYLETEGIVVDDFDLSFENLSDLEIQDGKIVSNVLEDSEQSSDENKALTIDFLNQIVNDDRYKGLIDKSGDGTIDSDEMNIFLSEISSNGEAISLDDIFEFVQNNYEEKNETFEDFELKIDNGTILDAEVKLKGKANAIKLNSKVKSVIKSYSSNSKTTSNDNYSSMSYDSLSNLKTQKETEFTSLQDEKNSIQNGTSSELKSALEDLESAQSDYETALANDEKISQELKDNQSKNQELISANEESINTKNVEINNKNSEIYNQESVITSLESSLASLEQAVRNLNSSLSKETNFNKRNEILAKISEHQLKIANKKSEIQAAKTQLDALKSDLNELNSQLAGLNGQKATLESERTEIEKEIIKSASAETKQLLEIFQNKRVEFDNLKASKLENANKKLEQLKVELDKINAALSTKEKTANSEDLFTDAKMSWQTYKDPETGMEYILFAPENVDPNQDLPLIVYLHGQDDNVDAIHKGIPGVLFSNSLTKSPNAYILCPLNKVGGNWDSTDSANRVNSTVQNFINSHNIDKTNVSLTGHSIGGRGVFNIARNSQGTYSRIASISPSEMQSDISDIDIPVLLYSAIRDREKRCYDTATRICNSDLSNYINLGDVEHRFTPEYASKLDSNNDGISDYFEFLLGLNA